MSKEFRAVIDDGTRAIPVVNQFGQEICTIHIRPADISILDRYQKLQDGFAEMIAPLEQIGTKADGTAENEADWEKLKAVETELLRRFNAVLDTEDASAIFAKRSPFSSVGGRFFCEIVFDAIGQIIASAITEEAERTRGRLAKYLPEGNDDREPAAES